jgi:hypothetical protein
MWEDVDWVDEKVNKGMAQRYEIVEYVINFYAVAICRQCPPSWDFDPQ